MKLSKSIYSTRNEVTAVLDECESGETVHFEESVEFISRAAGDEFMYQANQKNLTLDVSAGAEDVVNLFKAIVEVLEREGIGSDAEILF